MQGGLLLGIDPGFGSGGGGGGAKCGCGRDRQGAATVGPSSQLPYPVAAFGVIDNCVVCKKKLTSDSDPDPDA